MKTFLKWINFFKILAAANSLFFAADIFCLNVDLSPEKTKEVISSEYMIPLCIIDYYNPENASSIYIPDYILDDIKAGKVITYRVKYRDTLGRISKKFQTTPQNIFEINSCITDIDLIFGGNVIFIFIDNDLLDNYLNAIKGQQPIVSNGPVIKGNYSEIAISYISTDIGVSIPSGYFYSIFKPAMKSSAIYCRNILNSEKMFWGGGLAFTNFTDTVLQKDSQYNMSVFSLSFTAMYSFKYNQYAMIPCLSGTINYLNINFRKDEASDYYIYPGLSCGINIRKNIFEKVNTGISLEYEIIFNRPEIFSALNLGGSVEFRL